MTHGVKFHLPFLAVLVLTSSDVGLMVQRRLHRTSQMKSTIHIALLLRQSGTDVEVVKIVRILREAFHHITLFLLDCVEILQVLLYL